MKQATLRYTNNEFEQTRKIASDI